MTDNKLSTKEILELKARAHHLHPVVMVGQQGLTESVIKAPDAALTAHELIKVYSATTVPNALKFAMRCAMPLMHNWFSISVNSWYCGAKTWRLDSSRAYSDILRADIQKVV